MSERDTSTDPAAEQALELPQGDVGLLRAATRRHTGHRAPGRTTFPSCWPRCGRPAGSMTTPLLVWFLVTGGAIPRDSRCPPKWDHSDDPRVRFLRHDASSKNAIHPAERTMARRSCHPAGPGPLGRHPGQPGRRGAYGPMRRRRLQHGPQCVRARPRESPIWTGLPHDLPRHARQVPHPPGEHHMAWQSLTPMLPRADNFE